MPARKRTASRVEDEPAWSPALREPRYSKSIERGLAILVCFTPEHPVLGIADIAEQLGMSRSTTHRYGMTLLALGYLDRSTKRKYRLGGKVTDLGLAALEATGLREPAQPYLEELRRRSGCATSISVLAGSEILYLDHVHSLHRGPSALDFSLRPGSHLPAYCTAMGKLLLAKLPPDQQRELIREMKLTKRGPNTITSKKALLSELEEIRSEDLAVNNEELSPGLVSIAAGVHDETGGIIAAISLTAHASMLSLPQLIHEFSPDLFSSAEEISNAQKTS